MQSTKFKHKHSQPQGFSDNDSRSEQNSLAIQVPWVLAFLLELKLLSYEIQTTGMALEQEL